MDEVLTPNPDDDPKIPPPPPAGTIVLTGVLSVSLLGLIGLTASSLYVISELKSDYPEPTSFTVDPMMTFVQLFLVLIGIICAGLLGYVFRLWVRLRQDKKRAEAPDTSVLGNGSIGAHRDVQ